MYRIRTLLCFLLIAPVINAKEMGMTMEMNTDMDMPKHKAPIGVMGDHLMMKGKVMMSLRLSRMEMSGFQSYGEDISDATVLQQPNPFSQVPAMPMKLSVVPQSMSMDMLMLGGMYAPSDKVTIMGMAMLESRDMRLDSYKGMIGRDYLGSFDTSSSDLSYLSFTALHKIYKTPKSRAHFHLGLSKGIGSNDEAGEVLTPMNMRTTMTLPYGMQSSDHSTRIIVGLTHVSSFSDFAFGNQLLFDGQISYKDWAYGDRLNFNSWVQKSYNDVLSYSARLNIRSEDGIRGKDHRIMAPVPTADPNNYGGEVVSLGFGVNANLKKGSSNHPNQLGIELMLPINQDKHGLQLKDKWSINLGYKVHI